MLAQLSDTHLRASDPAAELALAAAVATVLALRPQPDAVLVSGDLVHDESACYERVAELLARLPMPVVAVPGNHDDRAAMSAAGLRPPDGEPPHVALDAGGLRLLALDDQVPGAPHGALDGAALAWVEARLAERPQTPTLIALHHPAWPIGLHALDTISLDAASGEALGALVSASPQVVGVTAGHVHRGSLGVFAGRPAVTAASTHTQALLDLEATDFLVAREPASILLHTLVDGRLVVHFQPVP